MKKSTKIALIPVALSIPGLPFRLDISKYQILTPKVNETIRFAILADLHNANYGKDMKYLVDAIRAQNPDFIVLPGDLIGEHTKTDHALSLVNALKGLPMYYVTGNHEARREDMDEFLEQLEQAGVTYLDQKTEILHIHNTDIEIAGLKSGLKQDTSPYSSEEVNGMFTSDHFRILLSHQPHWLDLYKAIHTDLVISGHAHGGQWRIPFINKGIKAPNQKLLSPYVQGIHDVNNGKLIISRGLSKHYHGIPKLYNNPEIIIVELSNKN